jgi:peptidoglycan/LPS O-acetylase OafA/YrhL
MRIFPVFAVTCVAGYFVADLHAWVLSRVSYASDPAFAPGALFSAIVRSTNEYFWAHAAAHLVMLHGAISNSILPFSQYAFNSPGWSLSLEWQFYLIAPLVIMFARSRAGIAWLDLGLLAIICRIKLRYGGTS